MRQPPPISNFIRYPITGGIILLAVIASLWGWAGHPINSLMDSPLVRNGELWRLITSALPHGNVLHLAFNAYWIWVFGTLIEDVFGPLWTLLLAAMLAMTSSAAEFAFLDGGIGLSGVGYGYFGLLWVLSKHDRRFEGAVDSSTAGMFVLWFFICIVTTVTGYLPVANIAHAIGCGMGAAVGLALTATGFKRTLTTTLTAVIGIAFVLLAMYGRPLVNCSGTYPEEARIGYAALAGDDNEQAATWFERASRITPRIGGIWFNLGVADQRLERYDEAIVAYQNAAQLEPANEEYQSAYNSLKNWKSSKSESTKP